MTPENTLRLIYDFLQICLVTLQATVVRCGRVEAPLRSLLSGGRFRTGTGSVLQGLQRRM